MIADAASEPYFLVVGQNHHPLWRATMDGRDLGPPEVVDGYALGWRVDDLGPHAFADRVRAPGGVRRGAGSLGPAALGSVVLLVP